MPEYHGDLMYKVGIVHKRVDDRNYPIALILLVLMGGIGMHRFYLNDLPIALAYFFSFAATVFIGIATLDFTLTLWYFLIASFFLFGEFCYFIYKMVNR